uniref:Ionotropic glutamate receptor L-glutamate and glycine-binding domain-containing protein n=1 Tax=Strigamia maritima TaxID=126957 RepID=T1JKI2_STRMM
MIREKNVRLFQHEVEKNSHVTWLYQSRSSIIESVHSTGPPTTNSSTISDYYGQILDPFHTIFNISLKIIQCQDSQFGTFINGSWTGMIGDLTNERADIAPGLSMSRRRIDYINYSPPLCPIQFDVIYRKLDEHEWNYTFYLQPCNMEIWLCIFAISIIVILVTVLANYVSRSKQSASCLLNFSHELLLCWPVALLHGNLISSTWKSMKFVFAIYIAFSMLLLTSYNSKLTSLLAIRKVKIPFVSLNGMLENTDFMPIVVKGYVLEEIFVHSSYENKTVLKVISTEEGIKTTCSGKFGFLGSWLAIQDLIPENCCLAAAQEFIRREFIRFAYSKQFAYRDYFNCKILLLKQYGILSVQFQRMSHEPEICSEKPFNPISLGQIIGPMILIMAGILIALLFGLTEIIASKFIIFSNKATPPATSLRRLPRESPKAPTSSSSPLPSSILLSSPPLSLLTPTPNSAMPTPTQH